MLIGQDDYRNFDWSGHQKGIDWSEGYMRT